MENRSMLLKNISLKLFVIFGSMALTFVFVVCNLYEYVVFCCHSLVVARRLDLVFFLQSFELG